MQRTQAARTNLKCTILILCHRYVNYGETLLADLPVLLMHGLDTDDGFTLAASQLGLENKIGNLI